MKSKLPDPSEQEISAACQLIRHDWSADEYRRRTNASTDGPHIARGSERPTHGQPPTIILAPDGAPAGVG